jgi:hypothetical protein
MTDFPQDTDSQRTPYPPSGYPVPAEVSDVTSDINGEPESLSFGGESGLLREAREVISRVENASLAKQTEKLLSILGQMMQAIKKERPELSDIPRLHAHIDEDESVLIEWIFPDFRVGFNIEPDPEDSGWHLVSNKKVGEITASGQLTNTGEIVAALLDFILLNI